MARRVPYSSAGVRRVPCVRCGEPSHSQWQVCADGRAFRAVCLACDVALNELVLRWMGLDGWRSKIRAYRKRRLA